MCPCSHRLQVARPAICPVLLLGWADVKWEWCSGEKSEADLCGSLSLYSPDASHLHEIQSFVLSIEIWRAQGFVLILLVPLEQVIGKQTSDRSKKTAKSKVKSPVDDSHAVNASGSWQMKSLGDNSGASLFLCYKDLSCFDIRKCLGKHGREKSFPKWSLCIVPLCVTVVKTKWSLSWWIAFPFKKMKIEHILLRKMEEGEQ